MKDSTIYLLTFLLSFLSLITSNGVFCNVSETTANQVLDDEGYTEIELGGHGWFRCGKDDSFSRNFEADGPKGKRVSGAVCCGWLKNCTIRH